jgi:hypothetical protein
LAAKRAGNRQRDKEMSLLMRLIRSTWTNLEVLIQMGQLDESSYTTFGLDIRGRRPHPVTTREWLLLAEQMGDESHPEIPAVDRATFTNQLQVATIANLDAEKAEVVLRERQGELKRARTLADSHLRKTAGKLKANLYDEDPPNQRRVMRTFGYRFEGDREATPLTEANEPTNLS